MRTLFAVTVTLALLVSAAPAGAGVAPPQQRDQAAALRASAAWLAVYPGGVWLGVELPQRCRTLPSGRRMCPIAIRLLAWTGDRLAPWRCAAHVLLPAPGTRAPVRRSSADCSPLPTAPA
jgi:hypothetical protein